MPVILHSRDYDRWLDRDETAQLPLDFACDHSNRRRMEMHEANPKVNSIRNNSPELLRQAEQAAESGASPL